MSLRRFCDGCGAPTPEPTVGGERINGARGGRPLPDHAFDWCVNCALVAFAAVRSAAMPTDGTTAQYSAYRAARAINVAAAERPRGLPAPPSAISSEDVAGALAAAGDPEGAAVVRAAS